MLAEVKFPDNLIEGMRLSVSCSLISGDLPITMKWTRSGAPIPPDPTVTETQSAFFSNLVFTNIRGNHAGEYTCTTSNSAASTSSSAIMTVKGKSNSAATTQYFYKRIIYLTL